MAPLLPWTVCLSLAAAKPGKCAPPRDVVVVDGDVGKGAEEATELVGMCIIPGRAKDGIARERAT